MSAQPAKGLVFAAHEPGVIPWTLLGFILLSAALHACGFFLFQIIYPRAAHIGPPPVQVGLITPGTPEADALLRWIDSKDPARAAAPTEAPIPDLTSLPYIPSYKNVHGRPILPSQPDEPIPYPAGVSGLDLVKLAAARPAPSPPPAAPAATTLSFSGPLKDAVLAPLPSLSGLHEADPELGALQPARFLLGVSDAGEVRYVFIQNAANTPGGTIGFGSGDKRLDEAAGALLEKVRFRPSAEPLTWGFATFYWGSPVYNQAASAEEGTP